MTAVTGLWVIATQPEKGADDMGIPGTPAGTKLLSTTSVGTRLAAQPVESESPFDSSANSDMHVNGWS